MDLETKMFALNDNEISEPVYSCIFSTTALYFQSISGQNIFPGDITGGPDVE